MTSREWSFFCLGMYAGAWVIPLTHLLLEVTR